MGIIEALAQGTCGVKLDVALPAGLAPVVSEPLALVATDDSRANRVDVIFAPGLPLVLAEAHRGELARALEAYARALFAQTFVAGGEGPLANTRPRTDDPTWSPMVDVEHLLVGGQPALRTVHRMAQERGREIVMGHLLVPLAGGLLELRVLAADRTTGLRESALLLARRDSKGFPPAAFYDDPAHDAAFPQHVLSRVRATLRRFVDAGRWRIDAPAPAYVHAEVALPHHGVALLPPPRFVVETLDEGGNAAVLSRTSFCATDGLEHFIVDRGPAPLARADLATLRAHAGRAMRGLVGASANGEVPVQAIELEDLAPLGGRPQLLALASHGEASAPRRSVFRWTLDDARRPLHAAISAPRAVADEVRLVELDGVARSWRMLG